MLEKLARIFTTMNFCTVETVNLIENNRITKVYIYLAALLMLIW